MLSHPQHPCSLCCCGKRRLDDTLIPDVLSASWNLGALRARKRGLGASACGSDECCKHHEHRQGVDIMTERVSQEVTQFLATHGPLSPSPLSGRRC